MDRGAIIRAVMALSGGMDSTALLLRLLAEGYQVSCISYDYGQKHIIELERASKNIEYLRSQGYQIEHKISDLTSTMGIFHSALTSDDYDVPEGHYEAKQMKQTVVPNRNAIFASILYGYALSKSIEQDMDVIVALGVHSGDHEIYPDCRPEFYDALSYAFHIGNWGGNRVKFELPFIDGDKISILKDAEISSKKLGLDFNIIFANTNTSYNPDSKGRSSGRSGSDIERILAFHAIGKKDPLEYVVDWDDALEHALQVQKDWSDNNE